jgi:hypothetical protein
MGLRLPMFGALVAIVASLLPVNNNTKIQCLKDKLLQIQ